MSKYISGHFNGKENRRCDKCDISIGDYVKYKDVIRCVGCWAEYTNDNDIRYDED